MRSAGVHIRQHGNNAHPSQPVKGRSWLVAIAAAGLCAASALGAWAGGLHVDRTPAGVFAHSMPQATRAAAFGYVALGDSITFGYGLEPATDRHPSALAYPYLVGKTLGLRTADDGIPGLTTSGLLTLVERGDFNAELHSARLVTIDIGSNDLLHIAAPFLLAQRPLDARAKTLIAAAIRHYPQELAALLRAVRARTRARIILLNLYNPLPPQTPLYREGQREIEAMNAQLASVAARMRLPVLSVFGLFAGAQWVDVRVAERDVHPTSVGQAQIAGLITLAILHHRLDADIPALHSGRGRA